MLGFFKARGGRLYAFRFRDWQDWKSCAPLAIVAPTDQALGTGDGATTVFQLAKSYVSGGYAQRRVISRPVAGSVTVAVDGVMVYAIDHVIDHDSGMVTFATAPAPGASVTAGFEFDVPVRFDVDHLAVSLADFRAGQVPSVPLIEVLP